MKILIVGLGSIGRRHLQNLATLGVRQLAAVTQQRCALPAGQLPPYLPFDALETALEWGPEAVFVCNPTALHLETALKAAGRKCHLFLEKPVSHQLEGLEELTATVTAHNLIVQVGFQFRFHPVFQRMKAALAAGAIGKVVSAHAHWGEYLPGWHPWEDYRNSYSAREDLGGGVVLTLSHPFDYLRWMLGEATVAGALGGHMSSLETDTDDVAHVTLRFRSGAIGSVYLDYLSKPPRHTLQIVGESGRMEWDADYGSAKIYSGKNIEMISPGAFFDRNEMFLAEAAHFLDCVAQGRQPLCTLNDGLRALEIACAAKALLGGSPLMENEFLHPEKADHAIW